MRFISTQVHGVLDLGFALLLLASPWLFQFDHGSAETWLPLLLASEALLYSLFTDYEWAVARRIPMPVHLLLDAAGGALLAASPWIFGFAHEVYLPHLVMGLGEIAVALVTKTVATDVSFAGVIKKTAVVFITLPLLASCRGDSSTYEVRTVAGQRLEITALARQVTAIAGLHDPESVLYDRDQDVFFISNMHGTGSAKDAAGYIVRVAGGDYSRSDIFVESGRIGAVLDAPKGMTIRDEVLWVTDIDVVRGFDRHTGAPAGVIDMRPYGAILLNDIATAPDGSLYITDSAIRMTEKGTIYEPGDRIFAVDRAGTVRVIAQGEQLGTPNGIKWHPGRQRWIVAAFDPFESLLYELPEQPGGAPKIIARGHGNFDGVEILEDGSIVVTSWDDYSVHLIRGEEHLRIIGNVHQPADLGVDTRRNRLLIPSVILGRVEVWQLQK